MAYVTTIGSSAAQVEYRLTEAAGCGADPTDRQIDYRANGERSLRWIGAGCVDYGVVEGTPFTDADLARARALMEGIDWRTDERLVAAKVEAAPEAKLPGAPLLDAILLESTRRQVDPEDLFGSARQQAIYRRLARGVDAKGELYAMHVDLIGQLADAVGVDVLATYGDAFVDAVRHREARIDVRNRGYDIALTLPKSFSVLMAYAPSELAQRLERDVFDVAAQDTFRYLETVASYGMRGHHGDGRSAVRIQTSGFVGWSLVHRASRAGDPHHHVHLNVANMVRGVDGKWSAVAAGGRDLMRHTHAAGAFMEARTRHLLREEFGVQAARSERTGQWEIVGIPDATLRLFSKRDNEIRTLLERLGMSWDDATTGAKRIARDVTRDAKDAETVNASDGQLRARWQAEGRAHGDDPARIAAAAVDRQPTDHEPDLEAVAAAAFHPTTGITANRKSFDRATAFAVVLEQLAGGVADLAAADSVVDAVLDRSPQVIALPPKLPRHMSDIRRFTTADLVDAEQRILTAARCGLHAGIAVVPPPVAEMALSTYEASTGRTLSEEQRAAYLRLVTAGHGVDALVGVAGSGKTTILEAARMAWNAAGFRVTGTSTAAVAAQNLQAHTGIPSFTIAALLHGNATTGDVLLVDEAAMVDERSMARILDLAADTGTKVVGVGDPKQLRAAGVGGSFAHVHEIVAGPSLTENRRQRDAGERTLTAMVRDGQFAPALHGWAERGSVHVTDTRDEALAGMVLAWAERRATYPDPHTRVHEVLMIAYTNADVAALNTAARTLLRSTGEVDDAGRVWRLPDGAELRLAVGDVVRIRQNLWSAGEPALLNGHRGVVSDVRRDGSIVVDRRSPDGTTQQRHVSAHEIARGAVSLGYAITDHAAQGQSADTALVYPIGMNANALYPAVTRHRDNLHVFIPLELVEDELTQQRLGEPRDDRERVLRGVEGLARGITTTAEEMVSLELAAVAERRSLANPLPQESPPVAPEPVDTTRSRGVLAETVAFYQAQPTPRWVSAYLDERGLRPSDVPGHGYAPPGWTRLVDHLRAAGFSDEELLAAGVASRSSRGALIDRMRDRLVLPIQDSTGPVALIGRARPGSDGPKWLNTPQTDLYRKGEILYGLAESADLLAAGATPVLVEGPLDVAAVNAGGAGRYAALAPLGTALTQRQVELLAAHVPLGDRTVVVAFDGDDAGTAAATKAYRLLAAMTRELRSPDLPRTNDPADVLAAEGPIGLRRRLDTAAPLADRVVDAAIDAWADTLHWPEGRVGALRDAAAYVAVLPAAQATAQVIRLMQRLDLPHETVTDAVTSALGTSSGSPRLRPEKRPRDRGVDHPSPAPAHRAPDR